MQKIPVIIIAGPTAVGKTRLSIEIAKHFSTSIISADSMQVYRQMDIGTAKPTQEEMQNIRHYLIDEIEPWEDFSVAEYSRLACGYIEKISNEGKIPVIVGGTGLYINSIMYDMDFSGSSSNEDLRKELADYAQEHGAESLYSRLIELSPEGAAGIHPNNVKRVIRALEIFYETGEGKKDFALAPRLRNEYLPILIVLSRDRKKLYELIDMRVDMMMAAGLLEEVNRLMAGGCDKNMVSMKGIGYKEIINYLEGLCTLDEAVEQIKRGSRRYAKRQLTWFRRYDFAKWIDVGEFEDHNSLLNFAIDYIEDILEKQGPDAQHNH